MSYAEFFELPEEQEVKADVAIRTGIMSLDLCLGGGLPSGLVEIYGAESTGKTALAGHIIHAGQAGGMDVMLCAGEKYDSPYMQKLGVKEDELVLVRGMIEPVTEIAASFLYNAMNNRLVVIDSLTALRSTVEDLETWNKNVEEVLNVLGSSLYVGSTVVIVNQLRSVWVDGKPTSRTESAARWVDDLFDVRMELSRQEAEEDRYSMIVNIVKNTLGQPGTWKELPMVKGEGVDLWRDYVRVACSFGVLEKRGGRYYFNDQSLAHGEDMMVKVIRETDVFNEVLSAVYRAAGWA